MRSHPLSCICLLKYLYWLLELYASGYSESSRCIWMKPWLSERDWHRTNGTYNHRLSLPTLLCWTGVTLGTMWFVSFLPTGCPTVPGPLSTPQKKKSIEPLRYSMIGAARGHWHSFLWSCHSAPPHCMLLGLYVSHGRGRPLHWPVSEL